MNFLKRFGQVFVKQLTTTSIIPFLVGVFAGKGALLLHFEPIDAITIAVTAAIVIEWIVPKGE